MNFSDRGVSLVFSQILKLFRQCGYLVFRLDCRSVPTVWYHLFFCQIVELFRQCGISCFSVILQICNVSVVSLVYSQILKLCRQCGSLVFRLDFRTVQIVWYLLFFSLLKCKRTTFVLHKLSQRMFDNKFTCTELVIHGCKL